jgi:hypothetical protein
MVNHMRYQNKNQLFALYWIPVVIAFLWITMGCQQSGQPEASALEQPTTPSHQQEERLYASLESVAALTRRASLIVIGTVEKRDQIINMARDVNDINKPDLNYLGLGQLYVVTVEQVVKGKLESSYVTLGQVEGILDKPQTDIIPSHEDAEAAREGYDYFPFTAGRRYLLFLEPLRGFEAEGYYAGTPHPNRFDISNPEQIRAESPISIPGISTLDQLLADIAAVPTEEPTAEATVISPLPTPVDDIVTPIAEATRAP